MKVRLPILLAALSLVFLAAACNRSVSKSNMNKDETGTSQDSMPKSDAGMQKDSMMAKHGSYKDYSADVVMAEQAAGQKVVLFFHAVWCPYCQAADKVFKDHPENIPAGISVLKTDYDSNTALKEKYGVNYQHTFVQIDNQGNLVTKWVSGDTDLLAKNIK